MKRSIALILIILSLPIAQAQEESCGLANLALCLPEKIYQYTVSMLNAPIQFLLSIVKNLLSEPVDTSIYIPLWAVIVYIISIFYSMFLLFAGFSFIISGYSSQMRENAKEWLKNTVLMVFFVQASYYLYSLLIELSASMSAGVLNMIRSDFFLITVDSLPSTGLQLALAIPYLFFVLLTAIALSARYLLAAAGVLLFPIALFLNFIPPLKPYGKLLLNILLITIFIPFFESIILLSCSMVVGIPAFSNFKALAMIGSFVLVNLSISILILFGVVKAAFAAINSDFGRAARLIYPSP